MLNMIKSMVDIEEYTPFKIDESKDNIKTILNNYLPWEEENNNQSYYEVYFCPFKINGLKEFINKYIAKNLDDSFDLEQSILDNNFLTCLGSFLVNEEGKYIEESVDFTRLPLFLLCEVLKISKVQMVEFLSDKISQLKDPILNRKSIYSLQNKFLGFLGIHIPIENLIYIHNIKKPESSSTGSSLITSVSSLYEEDIDENRSLFNSFFRRDLLKVKNHIEKSPSTLGKGISKYLNQENMENSLNIESKENLKKVLHPDYLTKARWIADPTHSLSLMQLASVNIASSNELNNNIFSVNGPPGTGKTTLLKDIFAENIYKKALFISENFKFSSIPVEIDLYPNLKTEYTILNIPQELKDLSMVVTSYNNNAVENISKELPILDSSIKEFYNLESYDIFQNISNRLLPSDEKETKTWGLISGTLGSNANRNEFFSRFYGRVNEKTDLNRYISEGEPNFSNKIAKSKSELLAELSTSNTDSWEDSLSSFKEAEKKVDEYINEYKEVAILIESHNSLLNEIDTLVVLQDKIKNEINQEEKQRLSFINFKLKKKRKKLTELGQEIYINLHKLKNITSENLYKKHSLHLKENFPSHELWSLSDSGKEFQMSSPWLSKEFNHLRTILFLESLKLIKTFILKNRFKFITAFLMLYALEIGDESVFYNEKDQKNKGILSQLKEFREELYAHLFIMVPIISCTFASFENMFSDFSSESLGWLFIDEAGQALPQAAAGAIWRSKNTIIVGDPLQIEPVNTFPKFIFELIKNKNYIDDSFLYDSSVQTFGDKVNKYKGKIGKREVGLPLKVHRRCIEPMFSISNEIAYENKMIKATISPKYPVNSYWLHVEGTNMEKKHYNKDQGEAIINLLKEKFKEDKSPEIFIITPFKNIAHCLKKDLIGYDKDWKNSNIGTVHTFQGKECKTVILCLGLSSDGSQKGARDWACSKPNLLNVAVTRAKHELIIVGDKNIWKGVDFFSVAYNTLNK